MAYFVARSVSWYWSASDMTSALNMQYLLVGLSLVLFYLVLLALSEHIGFTAAWLAASLCAGVDGSGSRKRKTP
jgi:inner membrane protein involved in colicin E2 resistance